MKRNIAVLAMVFFSLIMCGATHAVTYTISQSFGGLLPSRDFDYQVMMIFPYEVGNLISSDLTPVEKDFLHTIGDAALSSQNRVSDATAAHNCFGYMLDLSHWVRDPAGALSLHFQAPDPPENPGTIAVQRSRAGSWYEPVHEIKFNSSTSLLAKAKCGMGGVYETTETAFAMYYEVNYIYTKYYAPKP